jgi:hypothetical protein
MWFLSLFSGAYSTDISGKDNDPLDTGSRLECLGIASSASPHPLEPLPDGLTTHSPGERSALLE